MRIVRWELDENCRWELDENCRWELQVRIGWELSGENCLRIVGENCRGISENLIYYCMKIAWELDENCRWELSIIFAWVSFPDQPEKLLICQSCPQSFSTPWSLLRHAQNNHAIRLFIECGPYNANFTSLRPGDTSAPNQSEMLAAARRLSQTLMDRNPGELRPPTGPESVIPALALSSTLPVTQEK